MYSSKIIAENRPMKFWKPFFWFEETRESLISFSFFAFSGAQQPCLEKRVLVDMFYYYYYFFGFKL